MRPDMVVIVSPGGQNDPGVSERGERRLVQALVAQPPIEALDEGVLRRLAGRDVMPGHPAIL